MKGETIEVLEARLSSLKHIKAFIEINIREREKEITETKRKQAGEKKK